MVGMKVCPQEQAEICDIIKQYGFSAWSRQMLVEDLGMEPHPAKLLRWKRLGIIEKVGYASLSSRTKLWRITVHEAQNRVRYNPDLKAFFRGVAA